MKYYKFVADTPYCGTSMTTYEAYEKEPTEKELDDTAAELCQENAESYEYLVTGWDVDEDEDYEEELDFYYQDCTCTWVEISETEYRENAEG